MAAEGGAFEAISNSANNPQPVYAILHELIPKTQVQITPFKAPYDKSVRKTLRLSSQEADRAGSPRLGTYHILLGLLRQVRDPAVECLSSVGVTLEAVRRESFGDDQ